MQDTLLSLIKIALQVDPSRSASVIDDFETILSTVLKEPSKDVAPLARGSSSLPIGFADEKAPPTSEKLNVMNDFMQQNITEQVMGCSPSLVIHRVPREQSRFSFERADPFARFNYTSDDIESLSSIESSPKEFEFVGDDSKTTQSKLNIVEVHVVKESSASKEEISVPPLSSQIKIVAALNTLDDEDDKAEDDEAEDDEAEAEEDDAELEEDGFEEFPLKDGIHYKDPVTNIIYKEKEGITRVGVFNPDTNKFKRDTK
jgi:hypothetical protein